MTDTTPTVPEWAIERAANILNDAAKQRTDCAMWGKDDANDPSTGLPQFARYIAEHEEPPVDLALIEAREIAASRLTSGVRYLSFQAGDAEECADRYRSGGGDDEFVDALRQAVQRGIELAREQSK